MTAPKDRPIIFIPPMVRALLDGRKSQTRRVLKPQPISQGMMEFGEAWQWSLPSNPEESFSGVTADQIRKFGANSGMTKYEIGDRLWVRENWRIGAWDADRGQIAIDYCDGPRTEWLTDPADDDGEAFEKLWVSSCHELEDKGIKPGEDGNYKWKPGESPLRWRPSIHMPRWASRLTLIVTDVRVQRLQDISEEDALAEGAELAGDNTEYGDERNYYEGFQLIWEKINGEKSWAANPWVVAVSFKTIRANIDSAEAQAA